jgi:chromosome segregation ATPase
MNKIDEINAKITELRALWNSHAAAGKHKEAEALENEIAALERSIARLEIQQQAEAAERKLKRAVDAAKSTTDEIARHKAERAELETVISEIELHAKALDAALDKLEPAFVKCARSYPVWHRFHDEAEQEAYDEALGADKYPRFDALKLQLRISPIITMLRYRTNGLGTGNVLAAADARF